jgi:hypothetical protein
MKKLAATAFITLLPLTAIQSPAHAAWVEKYGGAFAEPTETNSTILGIMLHCVDGAVLDVYSKDDGPALPADGSATEADYFYKAGAVRAEVDGKAFPLAAAGSDIAVVLFSEGEEEKSYLTPLYAEVIDALAAGKTLTLSFDVSSTNGPDGSPFDTWARFDLTGATKLIYEATASCS